MKPIKKIYVNLSGENAAQQLNYLRTNLSAEHRAGLPLGTQRKVEVCSHDVHMRRLVDALADGYDFRFAQFAGNHDTRDSAIACDDLASKIDGIGIELHGENGKLRVVTLPQLGIELVYDEMARIKSLVVDNNDITGSSSRVMQLDALHFMSCCIDQELALAVMNGAEMRYVFDSSMYEKTPKDPVTGFNRYLGRDLLEFHGKAKTFGAILPEILSHLCLAFVEGNLDMLVIDLRGQNVHTDGEVQARRFERDYITPIRRHCDGKDRYDGCGACAVGQFLGILAYADVKFQNAGDTSNPFEGGTCLDKSRYHELRVITQGVMKHG